MAGGGLKCVWDVAVDLVQGGIFSHWEVHKFGRTSAEQKLHACVFKVPLSQCWVSQLVLSNGVG